MPEIDSRGRRRGCVYMPPGVWDRFDAECRNLEVDRGYLAEIAIVSHLDELDEAARATD